MPCCSVTIEAMTQRHRILTMPSLDRPREKLQRKGAAALSDFELLEVMIGSGNGHADVGSIARQLQKVLRRGAHTLSVGTLTDVRGVSIAQAGKLLAGFELA